MSTTDIKIEAIDSSLGIVLGNPNADVTLVEHINLKCPYCKQWWNEKSQLISDALKDDSIKYVIKLFNKTKPHLAKGNIMHQYVPNSQDALEAIGAIYKTQHEWGMLTTTEEIELFAEKTLGLSKQSTSDMLDAIVKETEESNVFFIPTMIVGDHVFDQKISDNDFLKLIKFYLSN